MEISKDILDKSVEATWKLIPRKSSNRYEKEYGSFCDWKKKYKVTNIQEEVILAYLLDEVSINCRKMFMILMGTIFIN